MKYKKPLVSIIMGTYNCAGYVSESIESIIEQDLRDWELIICDDASTDDTYKVLCSYAGKYPNKIHLIKNNNNLGLNKTLNKCLRYASGKYIARQDGDDISVKNRFSKQVDFLNKNKDYSLVSSNMIFFDENAEWGKTSYKQNPTKNDFIDGNPFAHGPCMTYKKIYDELGGYSTEDKTLRVEDYELWTRMYEKGYKGHVLSDCLYKMRNDKDAAKRRTWKNRINEVRLKRRIFKSFKIKKIYFYKIYLPIIKYFTPSFLYRVAYRKKYKK